MQLVEHKLPLKVRSVYIYYHQSRNESGHRNNALRKYIQKAIRSDN
jgi:hypothetical protein